MITMGKKAKIILLATIVILFVASILFACNNNSDTYVTIKFNSNGGSSVSPIKAIKGSAVTFPDEPTKSGYKFEGWYYDSGCTNKVNTNTFKASSSITLYALWKSNENYAHAINFLPSSYGTFSANPVEATYNQDVIVTISPYTGYIVDEETVHAGSENSISLILTKVTTDDILDEDEIQYKFKMPAEEVTISADFGLKIYSIGIASSKNGAVYFDKYQATMEEEISFIPVPSPGYKFEYLLVEDRTISANSFTMPSQNINIIAHFTPINYDYAYNISINDVQNGNVTLSTYTANEGTYVLATAVPESGYRLKSLTANGINFDGFFIMPAKNVVIEAGFIPIDNNSTFNLTVLDNLGGIVSAKKSNYAAGEPIELIYVSDNYILDAIYCNGVYVDKNNIFMPNENSILNVIFVRKSFDVNLSFNEEGGMLLSDKQSAYIGELVKIEAIPNEFFKIKEGSLKLNGNPIGQGHIVMTSEGMNISVVFEPVSVAEGEEEFNIELLCNDYSIFDANLEYYTAKKGEIVKINVVFNKLARLSSVKINGIDDNVFLKTGYFIMPNSDVVVELTAVRLYTITEYDKAGGIITADKKVAEAGEIVNIIVMPKGGYIVSKSYPYPSYIGEGINDNIYGDYFEMPAGDISLEGRFDLMSTIPYNITLEKPQNASMTSNFSSASEGTLINIMVIPNDGYVLQKLFYYEVNGLGYVVEKEIQTSFHMLGKDIRINANIVPIANTDKKLLVDLFNYEKLNTKNAGITFEFTNKVNQIADFLDGTGLKRFAGNISGMISYQFRHSFFAFEYNDLNTISVFSQGIYNHYRNLYENVDCQIYDNIVILSLNGYAKEDYNILLNGVETHENFVIYKRDDATFGVLHYFGNKTAISIPKSYDNRTITYIYVNAFKNDNNITTLSLGFVNSFAHSALYNLDKLRSIDLSNVTKMDEESLKFCIALENIYCASYNPVYISHDGVLYYRTNATTKKLIRYPSAKVEASGGYVIRAGYTHIAPYAFYKAENLINVTLNDVYVIENYAFKDCSRLSSTSTTSTFKLIKVQRIGDGAFQGCYGIIFANLEAIRHIGKDAFEILNQDLTIRLGAFVYDSDNIPIEINSEGSGKLSIKTVFEFIDKYRKYTLFKSFSSYFSLIEIKDKRLIMFETDGGTYIDCILISNTQSTIAMPTEPQKDGYSFEGWYSDYNLETPFYFNQTLPKNDVIIIYAKYVH